MSKMYYVIFNTFLQICGNIFDNAWAVQWGTGSIILAYTNGIMWQAHTLTLDIIAHTF